MKNKGRARAFICLVIKPVNCTIAIYGKRFHEDYVRYAFYIEAQESCGIHVDIYPKKGTKEYSIIIWIERVGDGTQWICAVKYIVKYFRKGGRWLCHIRTEL
ncbi:MAG: hypothetical protein DRN15_09690 [Thermoprotei archaeon]|nr:MAG: hypothetical protein DRN15_09690 [Thermoprotei archaeon]